MQTKKKAIKVNPMHSIYLFKNKYYNTEDKKYKQWVNIECYPFYNGAYNNTYVAVIYGELTDKVEKYLNAVESATKDFIYYMSDNIMVDYDDNTAYIMGCTEWDFIIVNTECVGRHRFETNNVDIEYIINNKYLNNSKYALPTWFPVEYLKTNGWRINEKNYINGYHEITGSPDHILEKLNEYGYDVIFQIEFADMYETGFCVWIKEKNNKKEK